MIRSWIIVLLIMAGGSTLFIFFFREDFEPARTVVTNLSGQQKRHPIGHSLACEAKRIEANTDATDMAPPLTFIQDIQEHLVNCDPSQSATLTLTATFLPSQILILGFPSEAELNADRQLRGVVTSLLALGYDENQIDRICLQGSSNRLSMKIHQRR